ncbi:PTS system mannose/fructose/sorbose family transporter subunit IID [Eubacteriales bacterium OttesenSCG-928-N14]|nr:PTS system mannose/fructose/sorbose family transporter subunit IID [Eubacteriales bacterium OttesenSCG-928-N14]
MENNNPEYRKIPKRLLWRCWFMHMVTHQVTQSYDRQYVNSFTCGIAPIIKFLYEGREDAEEQMRAALMRTRNYYLCEQSFSSIIFGIIAGMEEQKANGADIDDELIVGTRASLMGPLSGLGDSIHGSTTRQIGIALTLPYCIEGSVLGSLLMLLSINITPPLVAILGMPQGYKMGSQFVLKLLQSGWMHKVADAAGVMSMFIMGAMTAKYVNIATKLVFVSDLSEISIQTMLDNAIPGILPLLAVFTYYLCIRKKIHTNKLIFATMILGVLFSVLGVM